MQSQHEKNLELGYALHLGPSQPMGIAIRLALPNEGSSSVGEGWRILLKAVLTPWAELRMLSALIRGLAAMDGGSQAVQSLRSSSRLKCAMPTDANPSAADMFKAKYQPQGQGRSYGSLSLGRPWAQGAEYQASDCYAVTQSLGKQLLMGSSMQKAGRARSLAWLSARLITVRSRVQIASGPFHQFSSYSSHPA
jgi:hypothetical protein